MDGRTTDRRSGGADTNSAAYAGRTSAPPNLCGARITPGCKPGCRSCLCDFELHCNRSNQGVVQLRVVPECTGVHSLVSIAVGFLDISDLWSRGGPVGIFRAALRRGDNSKTADAGDHSRQGRGMGGSAGNCRSALLWSPQNFRLRLLRPRPRSIT